MQSSHRKRPRRLSATFVRTINLPGRYGDGYGGHGLSLLVKPAAHGGLSKSWAQAIRPNGRTTSIGLGAYPVVTLAAAREKALDNARAVAGGRDPRRRTRRVPTFGEACETVIAIHAESWKGARNEREWRATLREYAMPSLAPRRVDAIDTADIMAVLVPIWTTKRQTARRLRQRIGAVMKWAVAQGYREDNIRPECGTCIHHGYLHLDAVQLPLLPAARRPRAALETRSRCSRTVPLPGSGRGKEVTSTRREYELPAHPIVEPDTDNVGHELGGYRRHAEHEKQCQHASRQRYVQRP